jgi:hypothetical protein
MTNKLHFLDKLTTLPLNTGFWNTKRVQDVDKNLQVVDFLGKKCIAITVNPGDTQMYGADGKTTERTERCCNIVK